MDIDLYGLRRRWPSIRHRSNAPSPSADKFRATTLDGVFGAQTARRADPARVRDLLSQLIESIDGMPLSAFVPMAETIPLLLGLTPQNLLAFDEFLAEFIGTILENGRTVVPPSVTDPSDSISANRRALAAGALGVKRSAAVQPGRPRSVRRFDELTALFSQGTVLAAVLGDGDHGLPPATAEVVGAMLTAIKNNLQSGDPAAARQAGADAGALVAAIHGAFFTESTAAKSGKRLRRIGKNHYALPGYETRKKGRAHVIAVDVDGEEVPIADVKVAGSKFVRRRARGG